MCHTDHLLHMVKVPDGEFSGSGTQFLCICTGFSTTKPWSLNGICRHYWNRKNNNTKQNFCYKAHWLGIICLILNQWNLPPLHITGKNGSFLRDAPAHIWVLLHSCKAAHPLQELREGRKGNLQSSVTGRNPGSSKHGVWPNTPALSKWPALICNR